MMKFNAINWAGFPFSRACLLAAALFMVLAAPSAGAAAPTELDPAEALQLMEERRGQPDFVIVDLRSREEFGQGHIEGARLIPYYAVNFTRIVSQLDRNATILLYCQRGRQSPLAFRALEKLRFTDVRILAGGVAAWTGAGYPLVF
jgi:rhodanese-related sulfurtransferase